MIVHGFDILPTDLFNSVYEIDGWEFQIIKTRSGWVARRTPIGRKRTAILTPHCDEPGDAVRMLIRRGHLPIPQGMYLPIKSWKKNPYR